MNALIVCLLITFTLMAEAKAETLEGLYKSALSFTAILKDKTYATEIAKERRRQARSAVLPELSANNTTLWEQEPAGNAFDEKSQSLTYLSLSQNLFQGGGEYAALRAAKLLPQIAELEEKQSDIILFYEVAQKFFSLK